MKRRPKSFTLAALLSSFAILGLGMDLDLSEIHGVGTGTGSGICGEAVQDDFEGNIDFGPPAIVDGWSPGNDYSFECIFITLNGQGTLASLSAFNCDNSDHRTQNNNTSNTSPEQYVCVQYMGLFGSGFDWMGHVMRADSADAVDDYYGAVWVPASPFMWISAADEPAGIDFLGVCDTGHLGGIAIGDWFCSQVTGSGAATQFGGWINPMGDGVDPRGTDPDDWPSPQCCVADTATSMFGTTCDPSVTDWTSLPSTKFTDTGNFSGIKLRTSSAVNGAMMYLDNYSSGECEP